MHHLIEPENVFVDNHELKMTQDNAIIRKVKSGDTDAYALLVTRYQHSLLNYIFTLMGSKELVEDIGQEVFLAAYKALDRFDETRETAFSAWLFTIARNRCFSARRQKQHEQHNQALLDSQPALNANPEYLLIKKEQSTTLAASLLHIPEPFRSTLLLNVQGHSLSDIAHTQGVTLGTVKSRLFRAKKRLKVLIDLCCGLKCATGGVYPTRNTGDRQH